MKRDACANDQPGAEVMNRGMCGRWVDPAIVEEEDLYGDVEYWEGMGSTVEMECNAVGFPEPESKLMNLKIFLSFTELNIKYSSDHIYYIIRPQAAGICISSVIKP